MSPRFLTLAAAALLATATACSSSTVGGGGGTGSFILGSGPGSNSGSSHAAPPPTGTSAPTSPSTTVSSPSISSPITSSSLPVSSPGTSSSPSTDPNTSINHLKYTTPAGWKNVKTYRPVRPLTPVYKSAYAVPNSDPNGMTVLSLVYYKLGEPAPLGTLDEQRTRVKSFNKIAGATLHGPIKITEVGGHLAFEEKLSEPPNFHYLSWFVFGHQQILQVGCQGNLASKSLQSACKIWVGSIKFTLR